METELKLLVDAQHLPKLHTLPLLEAVSVGTPRVQELENIYYDTPELLLRQAGAGLRTRRVEDRWLQTMKAGGSVRAGLHEREEWEMPVEGERPDIAALREGVGKNSPYAGMLASKGLPERLQAIFHSRVTRTVRQLRLQTGDEVEMAIDVGSIEHGEARLEISEVELELKSGQPVNLFAFALELLNEIPLRIGIQSKAERGYALHGGPRKKVTKAAALDLHPSMSVEEAFEAIVANCMAQVHGNEDGILNGSDPENVHQMRVGLRRLRSALDLFDEVIACPAMIQDDVKWLASALGGTRDWEVLAGATLRQADLPQEAEVEGLAAAANEHARNNREAAVDALLSPRHARLQLQFAQWMLGRQWREAISGDGAIGPGTPVRKFARRAIEKAERRLLKRGKNLKENDPALRHRVRIAGKKARYATEFFASLFPKGRVKHYVAALSRLQQELGRLNDAAVATELLAKLQISHPRLAGGASFARGFLSAQVYGSNSDLTRLWKRFRKTRPPHRD